MERRSDHLQWCKDRANKHIDVNDLPCAFLSFQKDMSEHPKTMNHISLGTGMALNSGGQLDTQVQMKDWINGFN
jgi:hypothetical protein